MPINRHEQVWSVMWAIDEVSTGRNQRALAAERARRIVANRTPVDITRIYTLDANDPSDDESAATNTMVMTSTSASDNVDEVEFLPRPEGWTGDEGNPNFRAIGTLSPPVMRQIEPAGPAFLSFARRRRHNRTFSEDERLQAQNRAVQTETTANDNGGPLEELLIHHDPKDWKTQDHYEILGLSKERWKATQEQIETHHIQRRNQYHPDRLAARGEEDDGARFKCIQRAYETLSDEGKRRQYDSVDVKANMTPPSGGKSREAFLKSWGRLFRSEARFSEITPVPGLGDENSDEEAVNEFYNFWYHFKSWRSFEYDDEEAPDDNEHRDHRRHVEKKNNNARKKKKVADTERLRKLLDTVQAGDFRLKQFKEAAKANKNKKRNDREAAVKAEAEKKKRDAEEAQAKEKAAAEAAQASKATSKKAKEALKAALKKHRRTARTSATEANYFAGAGEAGPEQTNQVLTEVDRVTQGLGLDEMVALVGKLSIAGKDAAAVKAVFDEEVARAVGEGKAQGGDFKVLGA